MVLGLFACGGATPSTLETAIEGSRSTIAPRVTLTAASAPSRILEVPAADGAVVDGVLANGEWDEAAEATMTDESPIYSMHDGDTLYLAVGTAEIGAVNVAVATGEEIWILHSSAALGSARYVPGDRGWKLSHGFSWCCRSSTDDTDRKSLLQRERWQATIGFEGDDGVVEFEVKLPWRDASLAVSFVDGAGVQAFWPADLSPAARDQLVGQRPSAVDFRLEEWMVIEPTGS